MTPQPQQNIANLIEQVRLRHEKLPKDVQQSFDTAFMVLEDQWAAMKETFFFYKKDDVLGYLKSHDIITAKDFNTLLPTPARITIVELAVALIWHPKPS